MIYTYTFTFSCSNLIISFLYFRFCECDTENGDTLTSSDLVTRHYENLPYPEVKDSKLIEEEDYYKRGENAPAYIYPTHTLPKLNHFLYQGEQNFQ